MPYVDLPTNYDDYASLWYITNSPTGTVGGFDCAKATVVLLHPLLLDSAWLSAQFEDPRLSNSYNLIAFDARHAGQTMSQLSGKQDGWTDAADLAFALETLCLPAVHVWACESFATTSALRFAAIFPEMCLSVTLLTAPGDPDGSLYNINELVQSWCYAQELDTIEHTFMNVVTALCGQDVNLDLEDDLIAHLEVHYPPFKRTVVSHLGCLIASHERVPKDLLGAIKQPVLIIHGDSNEIFSPECAYRMQEELVNAKDGASIFFVKGAQGYLSVVPENASIANRVFASFLARQPPMRSDPLPSQSARMHDAMNRLAAIVGDPDICNREPSSPMAFSCVPSAVVHRRAQIFARAAEGHRSAFSPLSPSGRPVRRYSERVQNQWFDVDRYGMSHAAQSPENHLRLLTMNERFEALSRKLADELPVARARRSVPRVPSQAFERMATRTGLTSRVANTASLAARALQRLPI
ncbi:alpha/beta-hydrolase [Gloeopeniophorella convolvens]|nr:alpha/beta-hydrolase [Gloeopeniophorella convolvens]